MIAACCSQTAKRVRSADSVGVASASLPKPPVEQPKIKRLAFHGRPLRLPSDILECQESKSKRSSLHDVVHAFRERFGFGKGTDNGYTPRYLAAVRNYKRIPPSAEASAIRQLSKPEVYAEIRSGLRLRRHHPKLSNSELKLLCREIRAALVWRIKN